VGFPTGTRVKSENLFWRNTHFWKNACVLEENVRTKNFLLNRFYHLTSTNAVKNYDSWYELECFCKTSACIVQTFVVSRMKIQGGHGSHATPMDVAKSGADELGFLQVFRIH